MSSGVMLGFALLLVCLNGVFVAAEFSFVKVRKTRLDLLAAEGDKRAVSALFGVEHLDAYLSVCQLGITLASLGLGWIGEPAVSHMLRPVLSVVAVDNPTLISSLSVIIGFTFITLLHVVFGELVPKSISIQKAEVTVLALARLMRFFYIICLPLVKVMTSVSNFFLRRVGIHPASEGAENHSAEELRMMITDSSRGGQLAAEEGRMLDNIFSFYQKTAKDIMIYRGDVTSFDVNATRPEMLSLANESGHSRFPAYDGSRDNIIGFMHIRDILLCRECPDMRALVREPVYAPEGIHLDDLLHLMRTNKKQFAVVVDEYGSWQGIVSMEDIVEAIVGDIQDEFDNEEPDFMDMEDGSFLISGDMSLDDLAEHVPLDCGAERPDMYKILAAHFLAGLDRIPRKGDELELCGMRFTIALMDRNRVRRIRVEPSPALDKHES